MQKSETKKGQKLQIRSKQQQLQNQLKSLYRRYIRNLKVISCIYSKKNLFFHNAQSAMTAKIITP